MSETLIVFRHAEKTGDANDVHLSPAGRERAVRLATYVPRTFGRPDRLFAASRSHQSDRCVETITPLAEASGITIDQDIADHATDTLAATLDLTGADAGRITVACWHHERIPALMRAIGASAGRYPDPWPDALFNLVIVARFTTGELPTIDTVEQPF